MKAVIVTISLLYSFFGLSQDWRDTLNLARKAYTSKDYDKALGYYQKAQQSAPEGVDLSDEMGQSAYKAKKYDAAEKIYQQNQANKQSSKDQADNYHNLGNTRMKAENYAGAVEAYKEALRRNPSDEQTRYNLSEALRKIKQQSKKEQQQQQNSDSNQNQNNANNNSSQQQQENKQTSQDKQQQQNTSQNNNRNQGNGSQQKNSGQLSDKSAERMLDELMKREAATKRRMSGVGSGGGRPKSGKDW